MQAHHENALLLWRGKGRIERGTGTGRERGREREREREREGEGERERERGREGEGEGGGGTGRGRGKEREGREAVVTSDTHYQHQFVQCTNPHPDVLLMYILRSIGCQWSCY